MSAQSMRSSYTHSLSLDQVSLLQSLLLERGWEFLKKEHTIFSARQGKVSVAVYHKGPKILVQGKGFEEFVEFILEPEVLRSAELGYQEELNPEMYAPHFGIDESGKGDFFGPLVIAGVYTNPEIARELISAGIQDSKAISSDRKIRALADIIRNTPGIAWQVISMGPERYNDLYGRFKNLNRLLAWGHSRVIDDLLGQRPSCPRALSDQFAHESLLKRMLGPLAVSSGLLLQQRTKGESDIAVAAASILARERFINWMDEASSRLGMQLPRGASSVKTQAKALIENKGIDFLPKVAKMHFKTAREVGGMITPEAE